MYKLCSVFLLLFLFGCGDKNDISFLNKDFTQNRWSRYGIERFNFPIDQMMTNADFYIRFSHIYEPGYNEVPVEVAITNPDGKQMVVPVVIKLADKSGNVISDCAGDLCDANILVKKNMSFKKGNYKVQIKNTGTLPQLPNVTGVGFRIKKVE